jgi:UDP-N-acetylmuramoylalanine--D-glutamate ligase
MAEAMDVCATHARPGDTVLLSPACASFDAFRDFEHRGDTFRTLLSERTA